MKHIWILFFAFIACKTTEPKSESESKDLHTAASRNDVRVKHLSLNLNVDMKTQILTGNATYKLHEHKNSDTIYLDTKGLNILGVYDVNEKKELEFSLLDEDKLLGRPLEILLLPTTTTISIKYTTSKDAAALQWLNPDQTADKKYPFLYTQSQAILARSWIPCQDGPGIRFTYDAKVNVPKDLIALMSASNPISKNDSGVYVFEQKNPIPSYLMALAVGDIAFQDLGDNTGVYTEPGQLAKCANEFADLPKMLKAAEALYGKYAWGRYDVLVLPPSFPFGGMENPELTFATPTIIAGDRSLVSLLAHELAHSWSGNLVTNSTWNDFWLNEGFTVYFERRIMESIEGREYADMLQILGFQDLQAEIESYGKNNPDTKLFLDLKGRDPDDGLSDIAYEKGALFLIHIERIVGREKFDAFLKNYFQSHAFQTMDTKGFINYLNDNLIKGDEALNKKINANGWIYESDLPTEIPSLTSTRLTQVDSTIVQFNATSIIDLNKTKQWSSHEYLYFIRGFDKKLNSKQLEFIKNHFDFGNSGNMELQAAWFEHVIRNKFDKDYPLMESFLIKVGRRKFLMPLYGLMMETEEGKKMAKEIYSKAKKNYHYVSIQSLDELIK